MQALAAGGVRLSRVPACSSECPRDPAPLDSRRQAGRAAHGARAPRRSARRHSRARPRRRSSGVDPAMGAPRLGGEALADAVGIPDEVGT